MADLGHVEDWMVAFLLPLVSLSFLPTKRHI